MVKNGNFTFLLLELILAYQLEDLHPTVQASSGQEWQFCIPTVRDHIPRSTGISTPMVQASSGQEWQFHISTVRAQVGRSTDRCTSPLEASSGPEYQYEISTVRAHTGRSTTQYRHLVVKNGNFTFLLLELILADLPPGTGI